MKLHRAQSGLVSIIVTLVFLSVITLITISFAFLMRREQQQVLDRQLSTQAFYAAESGINDTIAKLKQDSDAVGNIDSCDQDSAKLGFSQDLDSNGIVKYTCILVDQTPPTLQYQSVSTDNSTVVKLFTDDPGGIGKLEISWQDKDGSTLFATNDKYYLPTKTFQAKEASGDIAATFANHTGILRTNIIPVPSPLNRAKLNAAARTYFLYPVEAGQVSTSDASADVSDSATDGAFLSGECDTKTPDPYFCNSTIDKLGGETTVYLRLKSIYKDTSVNIAAYNPSGNPVKLIGGQAVIDATGKANGVLRRIQVRVPLSADYDYPEFSLESLNDICKRLAVWPGGSTNDCPQK